jgi:curli biogenesis system outer membrane secretion channel CsgG
LAACASAPVVGIQPKYNFGKLGQVALLDFEDFSGQPGSGRIVSEALEPYLLQGGYNFVERSQMEQVLGEEKLGMTGAVDQQTAASLGKVLGASALIIGTVTNYSTQSSQTYMETVSNVNYVPVGGRHDHYDVVTTQDQIPVTDTTPATIGFSARLVDANTGEVLWFGTSQSDGNNPALAADSAAHKLANALKPAWPSRAKN